MHRCFLYCILFISFTADLFATRYSAEELGQKLFAVHATDVFPGNGFVTAGFGTDDELPENFPNFRCTVHFSIGELVRPICDWMSWEDKKYAIVTPLNQLYPQLVNLNCYDTIILGNLELTSKMVLVVPEGTKVEGATYQIFEYGSDTSLREAVDRLITSRGGWNVRMLDEDLEDEYPPALVGEENINTHETFQPILDIIPHLSLGIRWEPYHGEAWRFSAVELILFSLHNEFYGNAEPAPLVCLQDRREELLEHHAVFTKIYLDAPLLTEESKEILSEKLDTMIQWIQMIDQEIQERNRQEA